MPARKYKSLNILINACMEVVESRDLHVPDSARSHVIQVSREAAILLRGLGCQDRAVITAAAFAFLSYTNKNYKYVSLLLVLSLD